MKNVKNLFYTKPNPLIGVVHFSIAILWLITSLIMSSNIQLMWFAIASGFLLFGLSDIISVKLMRYIVIMRSVALLCFLLSPLALVVSL